ncbi:MAG: T9SS type A sorting domain-containing protein [Bacteroidetes bacterium]|nr:T9SS type A sorting domain-containing protein [Bacteroidota bacterium]
MKKKILFTWLLGFFTVLMSAQVTISPASFNVTDQITITVSFASATCNSMGTNPAKVYMHAGIGNDANAFGFSVVGNWGQDDGVGLMTNNGNGTWSITLTPSTYFNLNATQQSSATKMGMVFRNATGSQTLKKPTACSDFIFNVGIFQSTLISPALNSATILNSGSSLSIQASNTNGAASYNLKANGVSISTAPSTSFFSYNHTGITQNQNYELEVTQGTYVQVKKFSVIINPGTISEAMPSGSLEDGINYDPADATKATLVLNAPFKDFVYVAGSFNNWQPDGTYAMKKDPASGKFWLQLNGLTPNQAYSFQYWVCDVTSRPANSPAIVKTADPFSTLVLSPFDDPEIASLGVYPGLPTYPAGQEREVSVLQTGPNAYYQYNWSSATTNFVKPQKKDLVIYEVLVRDFDANRSYQDLINRIDYFKNLKVNAIQLMPVMEFEGNMSWGYNSVYHMALDKRYGPPAKLKEFIDLCHQNGIAVILDVALNHVFGRSPLVRMWMTDTDGDGWDNGVTSENPYCNQAAMHSYSVGTDLNHFREPDNLTNTYVTRTIRQWIQEYKIDGFRWDLTKGFTNSCPSNVSGGQDACTNNYQSDRVAKLKWYADKQWELDPNFFVIFEHLGTGGSYNEEVEWANYLKSGNTKGIMQWRKMTDAYANLIKGNATNLSGIADASERFVGYAESHDEERVLYKATTETGQTQGDLNKALLRTSAMGAVHLLVPGPKMIWHFGDLGWEKSLWTCNNGNVSFSNPDCKLDTKPQPQWTENWLGNANRSAIYNNWARLINLKKTENVFENGSYAWNFGSIGHPRLDIWTSTTQTGSLSYVYVLTNFTNNTYNVAGGFPFTGTWYNMMDDTSFDVTDTNMNISIEPGGFRVFGNKASTLSIDAIDITEAIDLYPNPAQEYFQINVATSKVQVYSITGQMVKEFTAESNGYRFNISDLKTGMYLVKITDTNNRQKTTRLIKE